ncbi:putative N-acetyltransferase YnaD [Psilocybe cubensis]|uniref:N-acetyltransferase YnaD n=2 Tax=Psilocybe cubensis TaxID=181762 RepID=A0ACB8HBL7_PSICU|nr:putative N-acetyltransferase YnaD [Psilocybe cubensis]KAH9485047.1 putative N-acetyltransferase YnaD [Psilocybe cubensis]
MPQHTVTLQSPWKRIRLVPPTASDDEIVSICRTHPTTRQFLQFLPEHMTAEEAGNRRETRAEDKRIMDFHVHFTENGLTRFAGMTGYFNLDEGNESCEVGMLIMPDLHGKNLATEVFYTILQYIFEVRNLHRVTFETAADNLAMRSWFEKIAGARLEAERREVWKYPSGNFVDVKGYAILEWEWRNHIKSRLEERLKGISKPNNMDAA